MVLFLKFVSTAIKELKQFMNWFFIGGPSGQFCWKIGEMFPLIQLYHQNNNNNKNQEKNTVPKNMNVPSGTLTLSIKKNYLGPIKNMQLHLYYDSKYL